MYLQNKYSKCYFSIIDRAKSRVLDKNVRTEKHHIIPKSLGGNNASENLVKLTLREHFVCHRLLPKMTEGKHRTKMTYAIWKMCHSSLFKKSAYRLNSRTYNTVKGMMRSSRTAKDFTPEWKAKISASRKGQATWNKGVPRTAEERAKMSEVKRANLAKNDPTYNVRPPCKAETANKIRTANLGKKWIYNPNITGERKQLNPIDCVPYLASGWKYGIGR